MKQDRLVRTAGSAAAALLICATAGLPADAGTRTIQDPRRDHNLSGTPRGDLTKLRVVYKKKKLVLKASYRALDDSIRFHIRTPGSTKTQFTVSWDLDGFYPLKTQRTAWMESKDGTERRFAKAARPGRKQLRVVLPARHLKQNGKVPKKLKVRAETLNWSANMGEFDDRTRWTKWVKRG